MVQDLVAVPNYRVTLVALGDIQLILFCAYPQFVWLFKKSAREGWQTRDWFNHCYANESPPKSVDFDIEPLPADALLRERIRPVLEVPPKGP